MKAQTQILTADTRTMMANSSITTMEDRLQVVHLDPDHPGFRDQAYRARRNQIARLAMSYESGLNIPDAPYTPEEHQLWCVIRTALEPAHKQYACAEYLQCIERMSLPRDYIPQMREVTERVQVVSGFRLEPVAGLVEPRIFLESLARGVFLSTQYIRHYSTPLYTPEPDVVHEIIGHAVTLSCEPLAELNRLFGEAVKRTRSSEDLERLGRVYWFTIEFGVLREGEQVKAYGAGLLSSAGEMRAIHESELLPFDLEAASRLKYDPTRYQPHLFCADSFEAMYRTLRQYLICWEHY
jgi:phenylalanine-4-hydroxylase